MKAGQIAGQNIFQSRNRNIFRSRSCINNFRIETISILGLNDGDATRKDTNIFFESWVTIGSPRLTSYRGRLIKSGIPSKAGAHYPLSRSIRPAIPRW
jgi:hypothetical protein